MYFAMGSNQNSQTNQVYEVLLFPQWHVLMKFIQDSINFTRICIYVFQYSLLIRTINLLI